MEPATTANSAGAGRCPARATPVLAPEPRRQAARVCQHGVSPGIIRTPMHAEEAYDTLAALHPVGRMGDVGDIVEAIAYLETAEFVTGEILHVDGGQSAGH